LLRSDAVFRDFRGERPVRVENRFEALRRLLEDFLQDLSL